MRTGELVLLRHLQRDQFGGFFPGRVVLERDDGLLLWFAAGTRAFHFDMPDGRTPERTPLPEWSRTRRVPVPFTVDRDQLGWHPAGADYSIRWFFGSDGTFIHWYGNLEAPAIRWRDGALAGLDTVDWDLDVIIHPDRSVRWKDEDEFTARLATPDAYWVDDEQRVRRAGAEVIALARAGGFPFDGTWCDFRPDPAWSVPTGELPPGWDRPHSRWPAAS